MPFVGRERKDTHPLVNDHARLDTSDRPDGVSDAHGGRTSEDGQAVDSKVVGDRDRLGIGDKLVLTTPSSEPERLHEDGPLVESVR